MNLYCVVFEVNLINNPKQWLVDTGATRYVCTKKRVFFTYKEVDGENLYMRNSSTSKLLEVGKGHTKNNIWKASHP